jgi:hypothetical protein
MNDDELLGNMKELLAHFRRLGLEQIEIFKDLNPSPVRRKMIGGHIFGEIDGCFMPMEEVIRRAVAQENTFLVDLIEGFWNYYLLNTTYLESPARQGIDRTLLEYCYQKLITFINLTPSDKKRKLLISRLCDIGMILAAPSEHDRSLIPSYTDDYNYFVSQLHRDDDKIRFQRLRAEGYPTHEFAKAKHSLWPSFFIAFGNNQEDLIFPWANNTIDGIEKVKSSILQMYLHQHDFVHGSHTSAITALESINSKKHLFASSAIAIQTGYQILHTVNVVYLGESAVDLLEISNEVNLIMPQIFNRFSHLQL